MCETQGEWMRSDSHFVSFFILRTSMWGTSATCTFIPFGDDCLVHLRSSCFSPYLPKLAMTRLGLNSTLFTIDPLMTWRNPRYVIYINILVLGSSSMTKDMGKLLEFMWLCFQIFSRLASYQHTKLRNIYVLICLQ